MKQYANQIIRILIEFTSICGLASKRSTILYNFKLTALCKAVSLKLNDNFIKFDLFFKFH